MGEYGKRSGQIQIPAFGNWDYANEMPITQYFECARQAGLIRYSASSSSGESDPSFRGNPTDADLYAVDHRSHKPRRNHIAAAPPRKGRVNEVQRRQVKKVWDNVTEPRREQKQSHLLKQNNNTNFNNPKKQKMVMRMHAQHDVVKATTIPTTTAVRRPKAVVEDLYKIPPELLHHSSKRKKMPGFFSCLVPACAS